MALVLLAAAVLGSLAVVAWALWPLRGEPLPVESVDRRFVALLAEREAALFELRDLDGDHADGRLGEADWHALRTLAVDRAARALAALDALEADRAARLEAAAAWLDRSDAAGNPSGGAPR